MIRFIDELVGRDSGAPGFRGSVLIGVRGKERTRFWLGTFSDKAKTNISDVMPEEFDVAVGLGEDEADALLEPSHGVPGMITGDRDLFLSFLRRYVRMENLLDVRAKRSRNGR